MFIKILIVLAVIVVRVHYPRGALRPSEFRIMRSASMLAPPALVFAQVNDFHNWTGWSPWEKIDPALKRTYEGAPAGTGAVYSWSGNKKVGEGRMTVTESRPSELIRIKLEFIKPFAQTNQAEFTFKPQGDQTAVTWSMTGNNGFCGKHSACSWTWTNGGRGF